MPAEAGWTPTPEGISRVVTAMATPFTPDGDLDAEGAATLARHLVASGTGTVLVNGTTGEAPTLRDEERWRLLDVVLETVGDPATVMVGTGSNSTAATLDATRRAESAGADAVLVVTPYYNRPDQRGLRAHFTAVAEATALPVMLYDIPSRTGREIAAQTLVELAEVTNVIGVKDATADVGKVSEVLAATRDAPGGFGVWSGADEANLAVLAVGGSGVVSVSAHLAGPEIAGMVRAFPSDPARARDLHLACMELHRALFAEPSPAPLKAGLTAAGLPGGPVRAPLVDASDEVARRVAAAHERLVRDR